MMLRSVTGRLSHRARRRAAWAAPIVVAAGVAVGATVLSGSASGASPDLPARTAAQLLTAVQTADAGAFSGEIQESANLGIPSLPGDSSSASLSWQTFVSGTHTARVWVDGAQKQRVALIGELSEADVVHDGADLWTYTSQTNTVTHTTLRRTPARGASHSATPATPATPDARDLTPAAAAQRVLAAISPSTKVTVDTTRTVAGRPAYTLELAPRNSASTISRVTIAIDATRHIPLQVQIFAGGSSPALQTGFSTISFATPAASTFDFSTPAGATVATDPLTASPHAGHQHHGARLATGGGPSGDAAAPRVIGSAWTAVVEIPAGSSGTSITAGLPSGLTTSVGSTGERLLHTALVNAVLMPDGRAFVGAVDPTYLEHVAASTH